MPSATAHTDNLAPPNTVRTNRASAILDTLLTALVPIVWGSTYLVTTEYLPAEQPYTAALARTLPAGLVLVIFYRFPVERTLWPRLIILAFLNIGLFQALLFVAAYRLPGGIAAVLGATQPLIVLALAWTVEKRRPPHISVLLSTLAIAGMLTAFAKSWSALDPIGLLAAAAGTASMGIGTYLTSRWGLKVPLLPFTGWQLLLGSFFLLPFALLADPPIEAITLPNIIGFLYLSIFGALIGYTLWFRGINRLSPASVSALGLLSPITAATLGWLILGQTLSARETIGLSIALASILLFQLTQQKRTSCKQ